MDPRSSSQSRSEANSGHEQSRVLLVEDNKLDVFMVQEAFAQYQIPASLDFAQDGDAAIRFIDAIDGDESALCPVLVLLDLNLPKRSGTEILAHLRRSKRCAAVKVVIVTSSDSAADRAATQKLGTSGYFLKPASYEEFVKLGQVILDTLNAAPG
jgi:chemotaxis family two-component system response regulator Rcp1